MSGQPVNLGFFVWDLAIIMMAVPSCYGELVPKGNPMSTEFLNVYVLIHVEVKFGGQLGLEETARLLGWN